MKLWDLRLDDAILSINATGSAQAGHYHRNSQHPDGGYYDHEHSRTPTLRSLALHEHAPVFAVGTDQHQVRTFNTNGDPLGAFEPLSSGVWSKATSAAHAASAVVGGYKRNAIVATAYHPHKMLLAVASGGDGHVSLVGY